MQFMYTFFKCHSHLHWVHHYTIELKTCNASLESKVWLQHFGKLFPHALLHTSWTITTKDILPEKKNIINCTEKKNSIQVQLIVVSFPLGGHFVIVINNNHLKISNSINTKLYDSLCKYQYQKILHCVSCESHIQYFSLLELTLLTLI